MPFEIPKFIQRYSTCVHRTHLDNVSGNIPLRQLWPAVDLYASAGKVRPFQRRQSNQDLMVECEFGRVRLNDQDPFREAYGQFSEGWSAQQFREELDQRVFFWPMRQTLDQVTAGKSSNDRALTFIRKYAEHSALLLVPTADLLEANHGCELQFSRCNSGTLDPRSRRFNVRGPRTFLPAARFDGTLKDVKELVFRGRVRLPGSLRTIPSVAFC